MKPPPYDAVAEMRNTVLHVRVTHTHELRWRVWLALRLILLAAWVLNCQVDVEITPCR